MLPKFSIASLYQPTVLLALALMTIIIMMILPMPAVIIDIGLAASFALAILIFTITLFIERPLDFSAFPTVLLASLMLRLSLNISSTKLIIAEGHTGTDAAGHVIEGFADFVMGGNIVLGLVVFFVILIVNFVVVTKGAGRMAEVGARFALDAMPGKQLAIDSDMAAGAIDHTAARERRRIEQEETSFFGSLDGASKFVKGDAIAGLLITALNFIVGMAMGLVVHDLEAGQAFETYAILTVGDALVTQIPAVIISIASALLLAKGGALGAADRAITAQLGRHPRALATVAGMMLVFAVVPGMPFLPFVAGAGVTGFAAWQAARTQAREAAAKTALPPPEAQAPKARIGDMLDLDDIHVEFSPDLVVTVMEEASGLDSRIISMRNHIAGKFGLILPEMRLTDSAELPRGHYVIRIQGVEAGRGMVEPGRVMVLLTGDIPPDLPGHDVAEPVYGAPARWVLPEDQDSAALAGLAVITPTEVIATHLLEVLKTNFGRLMTRRALRRMLDEYVALSDGRRSEANRRLIEEFIPDKVPVELLQGVMRALLEERVSVRNLALVLEATAEGAELAKGAEAISEHVRQRLAHQITAELQEEGGFLPLVQVSPSWEEIFEKFSLDAGGGQREIALPAEEFNRLAGNLSERLGKAAEAGRFAAVITSARRRRFLRSVMRARRLRNPVLSYEEIGPHLRPAILGTA